MSVLFCNLSAFIIYNLQTMVSITHMRETKMRMQFYSTSNIKLINEQMELKGVFLIFSIELYSFVLFKSGIHCGEAFSAIKDHTQFPHNLFSTYSNKLQTNCSKN